MKQKFPKDWLVSLMSGVVANEIGWGNKQNLTLQEIRVKAVSFPFLISQMSPQKL